MTYYATAGLMPVEWDFDPGKGWRLVNYPDGVQQVHHSPWVGILTVFIERVVRPKSRRKRWCIVSRDPPQKWRRAVYAPKIAGPFPDLEAAKAAYLMIVTAKE